MGARHTEVAARWEAARAGPTLGTGRLAPQPAHGRPPQAHTLPFRGVTEARRPAASAPYLQARLQAPRRKRRRRRRPPPPRPSHAPRFPMRWRSTGWRQFVRRLRCRPARRRPPRAAAACPPRAARPSRLSLLRCGRQGLRPPRLRAARRSQAAEQPAHASGWLHRHRPAHPTHTPCTRRPGGIGTL